jgi:hypothetical protein
MDRDNEDLSFDNVINKNYDVFYNHIKEFGYGMIVFPSIVKQLKGNYFINTEFIEENKNDTYSD